MSIATSVLPVIVVEIAEVEFFRTTAGLDIDKADIARYDCFINTEIEGR